MDEPSPVSGNATGTRHLGNPKRKKKSRMQLESIEQSEASSHPSSERPTESKTKNRRSLALAPAEEIRLAL